jgi:hypothetical protein
MASSKKGVASSKKVITSAAAEVGEITSRNFIGDLQYDMILLAFLERKHDFAKKEKTFELYIDKTTPPRHSKGVFNYFSQMYTTIFRHSLGLHPSYSLFFSDACKDYAYGSAEPLGLREANRVYRGNENPDISILRDEAAPDGFYRELAEVLKDFKVGRKIPIVYDFGWCLKIDAGDIRELGTKFIIVKNRESYSDPGVKNRMKYGTPAPPRGWRGRTSHAPHTNRMDAEEVDGQAPRIYIDGTDIYTGLGDVVVSGSIADTTIQYGVTAGGSIWTEKFNTTDARNANEIELCKVVIKQLISKVPTKLDDKEVDICSIDGQNAITSMPQYNNMAEIHRIAIQYTRKKCADNLSAASCKRAINYRAYNADETPAAEVVSYGGDIPCVFWTHDQLSAAFAIMHGIPTVLERILPAPRAGPRAVRRAGKGQYFVEVYLPRAVAVGGRQSGGACTRPALQTALGSIRDTSAGLLEYINSADNNCFLNLIAELIDIDSVIYDEGLLRDVIEILNGVEVKDPSRRANAAGITVPVLHGDIVAAAKGASGHPQYVIDGKVYDIIQLMYQSQQPYENVIGLFAEDHMAGGGSQSKRHKNTSSPAGFLDVIRYDFKAGSLLKDVLKVKDSSKSSDAFAQLYLDRLYEDIVSKKNSSLHRIKDDNEPHEKFMNTYQYLTVVLSKLDNIGQYAAEYMRFGSMFLFEFLSLFSNTEFSFLLHKEVSETFIFYNTDGESTTKHRGYISHKIVFFINAITGLIIKDIHNMDLFGAMAFMPDILYELNENELLKDMDMFLNTNFKYYHYYNTTAYDLLSDGVRKFYIQQIKDLLNTVDDDLTELVKNTAGMSDTAYFSYLEKHLPYGYISKSIRRANLLVANVFMPPSDIMLAVYSRKNNSKITPFSLSSINSLTKRNMYRRSRNNKNKRNNQRNNSNNNITYKNINRAMTPPRRRVRVAN